MFDLTIRTLQGSCKFQSVPPGLTVDEFKKHLHEAATAKRLTGLNIPTPENQNIVTDQQATSKESGLCTKVYDGRALHEGSLEEAGIQSGDAVVILFVPTPPPPPARQPLKVGSRFSYGEGINCVARHLRLSISRRPSKLMPLNMDWNRN